MQAFVRVRVCVLRVCSGSVECSGVNEHSKPSKVIHLRNIPNESSDADVIALGVPFGRVNNVLVLKGKNQAFLEMTDEVAATSMVSCYTVNPPQMRGRMVYVQFSNHRELKTDQNHGSLQTELFSVCHKVR
uniref:RRM domain-containing protein n=1 Tax=Glossina brevipalpis TaxID=37001 RepID=A0A1A9W619_9MUSC